MPSYANYPATFASESAKIFVKLLVFSVMPFQIDQNKNQNRSVDKVQNQRKEGRGIWKDCRQESIHSNFSYARYTEKTFYPNL